MTDPDLVFDMNPQIVRRVEQWIADRWPDAAPSKQGDGSRLTWSLHGRAGSIDAVVATESFLCLPADAVEQHLDQARVICDERQAGPAHCHVLLATDGARAVDAF